MKYVTPRLVQIVSETLGPWDDDVSRGWYNFRCPLPTCAHKSKKKFGVNPSTGRAVCFRCGTSLGLYELLTLLQIPFSRLKGESVQIYRPRAESARDKWRGASPVNLDGWLRLPSPEAGITGGRVTEYLEGRGVDLSLWECGLLERDSYLGRAVMLFRQDNVPVYFQARAVRETSGLKVISCPPGEGLQPLECWYGHDLWYPGAVLVVTEGPFDAIAATDLSRGRVGTCLMGKNLGPFRPRLWKERGVQWVVVMLDADAPKEAVKLACKIHDLGFDTSLVRWDGYTKRADPSSVGAARCQKLIDRAVRLTTANRVRLLLHQPG